jgi:hypothetical protein
VFDFGGRVREAVFGLSPEEATFSRRGFRCHDATARDRLEQVGRTFLEGYHAALKDTVIARLSARLECVEAEARGFAYEGAAMALSLLDALTPWRRDRFRTLLEGPGSSHVYMLHVGAGWALARLPWRPIATLNRLDPLLRWLAVDGYGFHQGYFRWPEFVEARALPRQFTGYARRAFDQGLGRSLWFVEGADVDRIAEHIGSFPEPRQADLWGGIGLACAYAGGMGRTAVRALIERCPCPAQLAQGAAFAAKARQRAGNPAAHTDLACEVFCGLDADGAARACDDALEGLPGDQGAVPAYELWRERIRAQFTRDYVTT